MTREDIIRMAREAQIDVANMGRESAVALGLLSEERDRVLPVTININQLKKFAALVAAAERERCAEICDSVGANAVLGTAGECARAIRSKGI